MRPEDIRHVGVVGSGSHGVGHRRGRVPAPGLRVTFVEASEELVAAGRGRDRAVGREGRGAREARRGRGRGVLGRIDAATDLGALGDVDLVIEAATEDRDAKVAIFAELGRRTRPEVVLASNTSSIPIRELGAASGRPGERDRDALLQSTPGDGLARAHAVDRRRARRPTSSSARSEPTCWARRASGPVTRRASS